MERTGYDPSLRMQFHTDSTRRITPRHGIGTLLPWTAHVGGYRWSGGWVVGMMATESGRYDEHAHITSQTHTHKEAYPGYLHISAPVGRSVKRGACLI